MTQRGLIKEIAIEPIKVTQINKPGMYSLLLYIFLSWGVNLSKCILIRIYKYSTNTTN